MIGPPSVEERAQQLSYLPEQWRSFVADQGLKPFRAEQLFGWIQKRGVLDPASMSNLPKALRERVALDAPTLDRVYASEDGSRKLLIALGDGKRIEAVLLPRNDKLRDDADASVGEDDDALEAGDGRSARGSAKTQTDRPMTPVTLCISTQVGCAMGCVFCASGIAGLDRHLSAGEIVAQVLIAKGELQHDEVLRNVVYMGMGEPLHNYAATKRSLELLLHPEGIGLGARRVTVSTSGLIEQIDRLAQDFDGRVNLAISLHQPDDDKRSALMPINRKNPLAELMEALRRYPLPYGRRVTIEYTLVAGQNDGPEDAQRLAQLLRGLRVKVNLIPMNPIEHSKLGPPPAHHVSYFQDTLRAAEIPCFVRRRRGDDVAAACGQLVMLGREPSAAFVKRQP